VSRIEQSAEFRAAKFSAAGSPAAGLPAAELHAAQLQALVSNGEVVVLSGAGLSTESEIPDYRGPSGRARPATPMTFQDFAGSEHARQRYWARSHLGWRAIARAEPNSGHLAVAAFQRAGFLAGIITQNVDGLHQAAGARDVIELHGSLDRVSCLHCHQLTPRVELERRLTQANPEWLGRFAATDLVKPDGDVDLAEDLVRDFTVVGCLNCGVGPLKPDVVFFGESVPPARIATCYHLITGARSLLVLGSSLTVASGFRFVRRAASESIPIAIVNQGSTRGDSLAAVRIHAPLGQLLSSLAVSIGA
jgi:NAD-dependent SIR2 family protein deacetylase